MAAAGGAEREAGPARAVAAWGRPAGALSLGLAPARRALRVGPAPRYGLGETVALYLALRNAGRERLTLPGAVRRPWNWRIEFAGEGGGAPLVAWFSIPPKPLRPAPPLVLAPGQTHWLRLPCRAWSTAEDFLQGRASGLGLGAGTYRVTGGYRHSAGAAFPDDIGVARTGLLTIHVDE